MQDANFKPSEVQATDTAQSEQPDSELIRLKNAAKRGGKSIKVKHKVFDFPSEKPVAVIYSESPLVL